MLHLPSPSVLASALVLAFAPARAQELIALDFQGNAHGIDVNTGQPRLIGPTGVAFCNSMATHDRVLYATSRASALGSHRLVTVDPITAQATVRFGNLGVDLRGLCSHDGANELFGIADGPTDQLVRIDLATGVVTAVGSTGLTGIQALDDGGAVGFLFGWDVNLGLVRIDIATGAATDVNPSLGTQGADIQFLTTVTTDNDTLCFGGRTTLYAVNRLTGAVTAVGGGGLADLRGAERHRGVATPFGLGCATTVTSHAALLTKSDLLPGVTAAFTSSQHEPNCIGILVVGLSNVDYSGLALPLDVDPLFGTSGCDLLVSPDLLIPVLANGAGLLARPFTLLTIPGFVLHFQYAALEAVPGGFSFSSGLTVQTPF